MNTITRPRKRPRVTSTCWRSFAWLVTREAALRIHCPLGIGVRPFSVSRQGVAGMRPDGMRRACWNLLKFFPERRMYYGP